MEASHAARTAAAPDERTLISEQVAPVLLSRVLNSFDMVVIFVAIVLFIVNSSTIQTAGPSAFIYWILGFIAFLIPGAFVTAHLGRMFPEEGSLYVWSHKALGPFWGFYAGFLAWWPGILVLLLTGTAAVTIIQVLWPGMLTPAWQQALVIIGIIWFSAILSVQRFRLTQNYVNFQFVFYAAAIVLMGLSGIIWLAKGHPAVNSFALTHWKLHAFGPGSNWAFFGLVILALLGIEVPLNMGVEVKNERSITRYLFWGSIVVMVAYLWATWGNMVVVPLATNHPTAGVIQTVQIAINHTLGSAVGVVLLWFFISNTAVYNYSFARLLFVSGLERRLPAAMGRVNPRTRVPDAAVLVQSVIGTILVLALFMRPKTQGNLATKVYLALIAAITVIWCASMVILFLDIFFVRRWFPEKFEQVRLVPRWVLNVSGVVGLGASLFGGLVLFDKFFAPAGLFTLTEWRVWLASLSIGSALVGVIIYLVSEARRKRVPSAAPSPVVGGGETIAS
jgi:glutamate:GABA antiporter